VPNTPAAEEIVRDDRAASKARAGLPAWDIATEVGRISEPFPGRPGPKAP
jgi:hypothetical protein